MHPALAVADSGVSGQHGREGVELASLPQIQYAQVHLTVKLIADRERTGLHDTIVVYSVRKRSAGQQGDAVVGAGNGLRDRFANDSAFLERREGAPRSN